MKKTLSFVGALCAFAALALVSCDGIADSGDTNLYADQIITLSTPSLSAELDDSGSSTRVKLRWNYITGAAGFRLVRYDETLSDADGTVLSASGASISGTATSYTDTSALTDGHRYRYELMALSGSGYTAKAVYLKDSGTASVRISYGNLAAAANVYSGGVTTNIEGTAKASVSFYPNALVEYRVRLLSSDQTAEIAAIASGDTTGTTAWTSSSTYYDGSYAASLTLSGSYDLDTTYYPYFLVRYKDTASFGTTWAYMPVTSYSAGDSLTTAEVLSEAGLSSVSLTLNSATKATVSGYGYSGVSYRVAVVDSLSSSETVATMKTGDTTGTTAYSAVDAASGTYQAKLSGTYSYGTTYYAVFMVKFTTSSYYDNSAWIYLNPAVTDSISVAEVALAAFEDGTVTLVNNASGGLTLTFPVVSGASYRYAVLPSSKSITYSTFSSYTASYSSYADNSAYEVTLSSDTLGNSFSDGTEYYLAVYVYSNSSYSTTNYYAYTKVSSLNVTVEKTSVSSAETDPVWAAFEDGTVTLANNASGGLTLTFPVVSGASYRYAVMPSSTSITSSTFSSYTVSYAADADNSAYKVILSSDTHGNPFTVGTEYSLAIYVYSNSSYSTLSYSAYTKVSSLDVTVYNVSVDKVLAGKTYGWSTDYELDADDTELLEQTGLEAGATVQLGVTIVFDENGVNFTYTEQVSKDGTVLATTKTESGDYSNEEVSTKFLLADGSSYTPSFCIRVYNGDSDENGSTVLYGTSADDLRFVSDYDTSTGYYTLTALTEQTE